jgi:hypothetical protein
VTWAFADRGKFNEGIAHGREGIRLAEALDHPYSLAFGAGVSPISRSPRGELTDAVGLLERGLALSREWNLTFYSVNHTGTRATPNARLSGRESRKGIPLLSRPCAQ